METKVMNIDVPVEQLAHDLAIARINKLDKERVESIGDMLKEYLEGVDTFKTLIKGYQDGSIKNL